MGYWAKITTDKKLPGRANLRNYPAASGTFHPRERSSKNLLMSFLEANLKLSNPLGRSQKRRTSGGSPRASRVSTHPKPAKTLSVEEFEKATAEAEYQKGDRVKFQGNECKVVAYLGPSLIVKGPAQYSLKRLKDPKNPGMLVVNENQLTLVKKATVPTLMKKPKRRLTSYDTPTLTWLIAEIKAERIAN